MKNPFEEIEGRLSIIENLLLDLKHQPHNNGSKQEPEKLLTVKEAANFLSLTVSTIYSKVSQDELPVMKQGKRLYFSNKELLEYLKQGRKKTQSEIEAEAATYLMKLKKGLKNE